MKLNFGEKIIIFLLCILLAMGFKIGLELRQHKEETPAIPQVESMFTDFILQAQAEEALEYKAWIEQTRIEEEERAKWLRDISLDEKYQKFTWEMSTMLDMDYELILAVMYHESRFNPNAFNNTNSNGTVDYGLMQVNSGNLKWVEQLAGREMDVINDPYDNIVGGIVILKYYYDHWVEKGLEGDQLFQYALNSYNAGLAGYARMGYVSRSYDRRIVATREEIKSE